jgi:hypothetical protein
MDETPQTFWGRFISFKNLYFCFYLKTHFYYLFESIILTDDFKIFDAGSRGGCAVAAGP